MQEDKFDYINKFELKNSVNKLEFIKNLCTNKKVLDLGCVKHNADFAISDPDWLHLHIKKVASSVLGIDYLENEVEKLKSQGFNIIHGDVTKPLSINDSFDVIVAGDLIEHLSNFEGFFLNLKKHLKKEGIVVISTPNPFYVDTFFYTSFKKNYFLNQEHTCWIDPLCLKQLAQRFDFTVKKITFLNKNWNLSEYIFESKHNQYDMLNAKWSKKNPISIRILTRAIKTFILVTYTPFKNIIFANRPLVKHSEYIAILNLTSKV